MIVFSDDFNFRRTNYTALFNYFDKERFLYSHDSFNSDFKRSKCSYKVDEQVASIGAVSCDFNESYKGIKLFEVYKQEVMQVCTSSNIWKTYENGPDEELWSFIVTNFNHELSLGVVSAKFWIDYWESYISTTKVQAGIAFNGAQIYNRAFTEVLKCFSIPVYCVEHFFTGHDFYFEQRYSSISNNSVLRSNQFCREKLKSSTAPSSSIYSKLFNAKNKNVKKIPYLSMDHAGYCLILAQVCNDYAITSSHNHFKNSIKFYIKLVGELLKHTKTNIVIKTHPYEATKLAADVQGTYAALMEYKNNLPEDLGKRLMIVDNYSIDGLIDASRYIVTLNSQSGLEALQRGKPVVCFGGAFYQGKGFTYDFDSIEEFIKVERDIALSPKMFNFFLDFMYVSFNHLIGTNEEFKLEKIFESTKHSFAKRAAGTPVNGSLKASSKKVKTKNKRIYRLARKFLTNPRRFFADSRFGLLRLAGKVIK